MVTQTESSLGDADNLLQSARQLLVQAGNGTLSDADRKSIASQLQAIRGELLGVANQSNGAGAYLFGGQGANQQPFVDTPSGVQYATTAGQIQSGAGTNLPLSTDGKAVWLSAPTGNGVFVTSAAPGVANATIDAGSVSDPSALTGANYALDFSVAAGVTTYAVLKNGLPTAVTAAPYVSGQAITVDGMTVSVSGTPRWLLRLPSVASTAGWVISVCISCLVICLTAAGSAPSPKTYDVNDRPSSGVMVTSASAKVSAATLRPRVRPRSSMMRPTIRGRGGSPGPPTSTNR